MKKRTVGGIALVVASAGAALAFASPHPQVARDRGSRDLGTVYVRSQGLFFDTAAVTDLPPKGPFQLLEMGPNGAETDFGPGDVGYVGGRWKADFDGDGQYRYFLCPLLPPGHPEP